MGTQICNNCIMDSSDSMIKFDENGMCDHCNGFYANIQPNWHTDEQGWNDFKNDILRINTRPQSTIDSDTTRLKWSVSVSSSAPTRLT